MRLKPAISAAALVLFAAPTARAGGFYLTDIGTRGMARAGAFVAAPDSLLAIHYNPAALSYLKGMQTETSLTLVSMDVGFQRSCPCVDPSVENAAALDQQLEATFQGRESRSSTVLEIPFLAVGYGFDFMDLTVALAAWGPNSGRHNYGALPSTRSSRFTTEALDQPGRYSGLHMKTIEANFALGMGFRPLAELLPGLRLGAVVMGFQTSNAQTLHLWTNSGTLGAEGPEDPGLDAPIFFNFKEAFALNWGLGVTYEFAPWLQIGSSFRAQRNINTTGTIDVDLPQAVQGVVTVQGNEVEVSLATAPIWRTGVQVGLPGVFRTEAAFVYEGWSVHDRVVIRPRNIAFDILGNRSPLGEIVADRQWRDTWSLRLGGELNLFDPLFGVQAGYFFEPSAIAPERLDPSRIDLDKHGFALGLRTQFAGITLAVSGMYVTLASRTVTNNQMRMTAPLDGHQDFITTVGNGTYGGSYFIGSASLAIALDPLLDAF